jgi:hypothetical protein
MMNSTGKWLVRAGSLILLLGFFLPTMAVSCNGLVKQSFSLFDLATSREATINQPLLFLVLLGAIAVIVFSLIPSKTKELRWLFVILQVVSVGFSALCLFISVLTLYGQFRQSSGGLLGLTGLSLDFSLEAGFFILILGYISTGAGIILQFIEEFKSGKRSPIPYYDLPSEPPPVDFPPQFEKEREAQVPGARIEIKGAPGPYSMMQLTDRLLVGRSQECQLKLPDSEVSRIHACFRFGNGAWFIQDQGSSGGTFVNGQRVQRTRLNPGDQIKIGKTILIFRS